MINHKHLDEQQKHGTGKWDEATARWYVEKHGDHPTNHQTVALAKLAPDDIVLDIGCGSGTAVREAAKVVTEGQIIGVDPTPAMVRIAEEKTVGNAAAARIRFLEGGAESLPVDSGTVTVAMAINSVHHWHNLTAGVAELYRVLAPGGRLVMGDEVMEEGEHEPTEAGGLSTFDAFQQALLEIGFVDLTTDVHLVNGGRMTVLQAVRSSRDC